MKVVAGLGNPGRRYRDTRHNVGFRVLDELASQFAAGPQRSQFEAQTSEIRVSGERVVLLAPQTYMNRSGSSVASPTIVPSRAAPSPLMPLIQTLNTMCTRR